MTFRRPTRGGRRALAAGAALAALAAVAAAVALVSGCATGTDTVADTSASPSPSPVSAATLTITPVTGARRADPQKGIVVRAHHGSILKVTVKSSGEPVVGERNDTWTAWRSTWALNTSAKYTVRATAVDKNGLTTTARSTFSTMTPTHTFSAQIFQATGQSYGVGMPVMLTFSQPITDKAAVERSLQLWSSKPVVGAWFWDGDYRVYFRPRNYWRPHTTVRFVGHLDGVEGSPGVYGVHTLRQTFEIGRSLIVVVDTAGHHMHVYLDRRLYGTWPVSTGKPGDETPNGTYLTIEKGNPVEMKGPGYDLMVPLSVRFTWSGAYLHAASWSVGSQGFSNVSHGCVNMSPADAQIYYDMAVPGDPVTVINSPKPGAWGNGWTMWFMSWKDYVAGSALHQAVRVGPNGSRLVPPATIPPSRAQSPLDSPQAGNADAG